MKSIKIPLVLMILLTSYSLKAQIKIGASVGTSFSNVTAKSNEGSVSLKGKTGITAGIFTGVVLGKNLSFQPALNFVQKGYVIKDQAGTGKAIFNYLELPLDFVYSAKRNEGFFIGAGPSIAYGISGKEKFTYNGSGMPPSSDKIKFGSGGEEVKPFEIGANILAGYLFKGGLMISGNYNFGLSKINNDDGSGTGGTIKNKYFAVKIGYIFNDK